MDSIEKQKEVDASVNAELQSILDGAKKKHETDTPERIEVDRDDTYDRTSPSVDPSLFDNPAATAEYNNTEVSEPEKEAFLEAVLLDTNFSIDVKLIERSITVRSRNTYEQALAFQCVLDLADKQGRGFDFLLWLQRFNMALAVTKVFGKDTGALSFDGDSVSISQAHKDELTKYVTETFVNMHYPKWQLLLRAFMIFTIKEKKLIENVANKDFWNPVG